MKKLPLLLALALLTGAAQAQNAQNTQSARNGLARRGYVGAGYGAALLSSADPDKHASGGFQLGANFGYLFSAHIGVAASGFCNVYTSEYASYWGEPVGTPDEAWQRHIRLKGIVVGPLFTASSASGRFDFDLRPYVGFNTWSVDWSGDLEWGPNESPSTWFAGGIGLSTRWNCWKYLSVCANFDNMLSRPHRTNMFSTVLSLGVNYRIK